MTQKDHFETQKCHFQTFLDPFQNFTFQLAAPYSFLTYTIISYLDFIRNLEVPDWNAAGEDGLNRLRKWCLNIGFIPLFHFLTVENITKVLLELSTQISDPEQTLKKLKQTVLELVSVQRRIPSFSYSWHYGSEEKLNLAILRCLYNWPKKSTCGYNTIYPSEMMLHYECHAAEDIGGDELQKLKDEPFIWDARVRSANLTQNISKI